MAANMYPNVSNLNFRELQRVTDDVRSIIGWYRQHSSLATRLDCYTCGGEMIEDADNKRADGVCWRCCEHNCRKEVLIRTGSFFGDVTSLELVKIVDLLYYYLYEQASVKTLIRELQITSETIVNWQSFMHLLHICGGTTKKMP